MNLPKSSWRTLKAGLIYLLCFVLEWILGTDPRTLGDAPFGRIAALLLEAVIMLIAMILSVGNATLQHAPDSRLDNHDGPSGAGDIGTCRDLGRLVGAKVITAGYLASFATAPGVISLLMFLTFAAMPTLVTLLRHGRFGAISSGPR